MVLVIQIKKIRIDSLLDYKRRWGVNLLFYMYIFDYYDIIDNGWLLLDLFFKVIIKMIIKIF